MVKMLLTTAFCIILEVLADVIRQKKGNKRYANLEGRNKTAFADVIAILSRKSESTTKKFSGTNKQLEKSCGI